MPIYVVSMDAASQDDDETKTKEALLPEAEVVVGRHFLGFVVSAFPSNSLNSVDPNQLNCLPTVRRPSNIALPWRLGARRGRCDASINAREPALLQIG